MKLETNRKLPAIFCIFVIIMAVPTPGGGELVQLSESVYSYLDVGWDVPGNRFGANAGIIIGDDAVLVVDTLTNAKEAELFLLDIEKVTDKPIRYVVNTHAHLDHSWGNCVFADRGAQIIAHAACRDTMLATGEEGIENAGMYGLTPEAMEGTRPVAPTLAFSRELIMDLGNRPVRLIHPGYQSHTAGSIMVYVPGEEILFTGDILFTDRHPYMGEGDLEKWQDALDAILKLNAKKIVPGHGPLSAAKDIVDLKTYLLAFDRHAKALCVKNGDPEKIAAEMVKILPRKAAGEPIIMMNLQMRYLKKPAPPAAKDS